MTTQYFKLIGQKTAGKLILVAVVDEDFLGEVPSIFEVQCINMPKTIYTGTYPTIKINSDTITDITKEKTGLGISGIITESDWYCKTTKGEDTFGISIDK